MFTTPLQNALLFTVSFIFSIYISIVLFRFILQLVRADFRNPVAQFIVKATNPLLIPLRKVIPGFGGFDCAALVLAIVLQAIELCMTLFIKGFSVALTASSLTGLFIWSIGELTDACLVILLCATFVQIIFSWLQPNAYNPVAALFSQVTAPLFTPARRLIPSAGAIDFSPMLVIFFIVLMRILLAQSIIQFGRSII